VLETIAKMPRATEENKKKKQLPQFFPFHSLYSRSI